MVAQPGCSSATSLIDNLLGGSFLHWCYAPSGRTEKCGLAGRNNQGPDSDPALDSFRLDYLARWLFMMISAMTPLATAARTY